MKQEQVFNQLHLLYRVSGILSMAQEIIRRNLSTKPGFNFTLLRLVLWWTKWQYEMFLRDYFDSVPSELFY